MELVSKYLDVRKVQQNGILAETKIKEDLGLCHNILMNASHYNELPCRAKAKSVVVKIDGLTQRSGYDYLVEHDSKSSYIIFLHDNSETLNGRLVEVIYHGYKLEGDR